jgi:hypothetical protein
MRYADDGEIVGIGIFPAKLKWIDYVPENDLLLATRANAAKTVSFE